MTRSRNRRSERGASIALVAILLPTIIIMTGFAVDLGRQRSDRRTMQAVADVVSLDMARLADGRTIAAIEAGDGPAEPAPAEKAKSAARNGVDPSQLTLDWGTVDPATGVYTSLNFDPAGVPNAARVTARDVTDYNFRPGSGTVERVAVGRQGASELGGFKVGSFGATLDPSQSAFLTSVISPILGNPPTLTAAGYQGLAGATVNAGELAAELGLLDPDDAYNSEVSMSDAMLASAAILRRNGQAAEADALEGAVTGETDNASVSIGDMVSAGNGAENSGLESDIDVLDILTTGAFLSRCDPDPTGFDDCSGFSLPAIAANAPLLSSTGFMKVVQSPRWHVGPVNTGVSTGQIQAGVDSTVGSQAVGTCTPSLTNLCLVSGLLVTQVDATVRVDMDITLAGGRNTIADIICDDPTALGLDIASLTDLYDIDLTVTVAFGKRGLLGGALASSLGSLVYTGSTSSTNVGDYEAFRVPPDELGVTERSTGLGNAGLSGITMTASGTGVLGTLGTLGINRTNDQILTTYVNPFLTQIEQQVVSPMTALLGLNVAGSDLTPTRIDCDFNSVQLVG